MVSKKALIITIAVLFIIIVGMFISNLVKKSYCEKLNLKGKLFSGGWSSDYCRQNPDGSITDIRNGVIIKDTCTDDKVITDAYCKDGETAQIGRECPERCLRGSCVSSGGGSGDVFECITSSQPADLSGDSCVDMIDIQMMTDMWGEGCGEGIDNVPCSDDDCWFGGADLSGDGCVDNTDFAILSSYWRAGC